VGADEKTPRGIPVVDISEQRRDGVVHLVIRLADAMHVVAHREVHDDRRDVIRYAAIFLVHLPQRVTHDDVGEQRKRGVRRLTRVHERLRKARIIQERVEPVAPKRFFGGLVFGIRTACNETQRKLRIIARESLTNVGENQEVPP
jgi:hypothetical protein